MKLIEIMRKAGELHGTQDAVTITEAEIDIRINNGRKYIEFDFDGLKEVIELEDNNVNNQIHNCENCHHYNSLIHWAEGLFHQCMRENKLWEECNDYDPIKTQK